VVLLNSNWVDWGDSFVFESLSTPLLISQSLVNSTKNMRDPTNARKAQEVHFIAALSQATSTLRQVNSCRWHHLIGRNVSVFVGSAPPHLAGRRSHRLSLPSGGAVRRGRRPLRQPLKCNTERARPPIDGPFTSLQSFGDHRDISAFFHQAAADKQLQTTNIWLA
jgi:hypothetical protein